VIYSINRQKALLEQHEISIYISGRKATLNLEKQQHHFVVRITHFAKHPVDKQSIIQGTDKITA